MHPPSMGIVEKKIVVQKFQRNFFERFGIGDRIITSPAKSREIPDQPSKTDRTGSISCKHMATHILCPSISTARTEKRYACSMARRIFALVVIVILLPLVGGCGFPVRYNWPRGLSPDEVRHQLTVGASREATRATLGLPYQATEITHTWSATFYDLSDPRFPIVQHESRDEFWIRGSKDFLWLFPEPPGHVQLMTTAYEVLVEYDGDNRVARFEIGSPGKMPKPPTTTSP